MTVGRSGLRTLNLNPHLSLFISGNWKNGLKIGSDPEQKVFGILGMGGIGSVSLSILSTSAFPHVPFRNL